MKFSFVKSASTYQRRPPVNLAEENAWRFKDILVCNTSEAAIHKYEKVTVFKYFLIAQHTLLKQYCLPIQKRGEYSLKHFIKAYFKKRRLVKSGIWITDLWSNNYFHWILECMPRLLELRKRGLTSPLIIPQKFLESSFIHASLQELEIEVCAYSFDESLEVGELLVMDNDSPCAFDLSYIANLRNLYFNLDNADAREGHKLVYISRKKSTRRRILNEDELEQYLNKVGFETVYCEELSFQEQRSLMYSTKVLISSHGAGLTNLLFLPATSKVIELHPDTRRYNSCFYHLAAAIPIDYYYYFAQANNDDPQKANITVDCSKLDVIVRNCL